MKNLLSAPLRLWPLAALLTLGACHHDSDPIDPPQEVAVPPTPYALTIPSNFPAVAQPADNPLTNEGVELGRHLFYETALSLDNTISCATCHQQAKAFTDGRALALGVNGARHTRSSMALANLLWEPKLTWDGGSRTLEEQARVPLANPIEMHQPITAGIVRLQAMPKYPALFFKAFGTKTITEENALKALAQFERTLISANSRFDDFKRNGNRTALTPDEVAGMLLLRHPNPAVRGERGGNCNDCHGGDLFTNHEFSNNGLDATFTDLGLATITGRPTDQGKFRVPSLRNIALTAPYMHDGRFATLEDVLDHYNEHIVRNSPNLDPLIQAATNNVAPANTNMLGLTTTEKQKIIAFLKTLTDSTFIKDPRFSKPTD